MFKPKKTDRSMLAQFFYADEELNMVATELDSFDGRKDPERCSALVHQLRVCQDKVLTIIEKIMEEDMCTTRGSRDFRVKFPDDVLQEGFAGQLWFGAECLAAGSSIMNREVESASMRPLAKALTRHLDYLRSLLRDQCLKNGGSINQKIREALELFDRLFAEFELSYVSAMVPVKTMREYDVLQEVIVLFSETTQRALKLKLLTQDMVDDYDPALMFTIPRLAMVCGLLIYPEGPLNPDMDPMKMSEMFRPFQTLLYKIRELLWTLSRDELWMLEKTLCIAEEPGVHKNPVDPLSSLEALENPPYSPTFHPALAGHMGEFPAAAGAAADILYDSNGNCTNAIVAELAGHEYGFISHSPSTVTIVANPDLADQAETASVSSDLEPSGGSLPHQDSHDSGMLSENGSVRGGAQSATEDHRTLSHSMSWPESQRRKWSGSHMPYCEEASVSAEHLPPRTTCTIRSSAHEFSFNLPVNTSQTSEHDEATIIPEMVEPDTETDPSTISQSSTASTTSSSPSSASSQRIFITSSIAHDHQSAMQWTHPQISFVTDTLNEVFVTDQSSLNDKEENLVNSSKCCHCQGKHPSSIVRPDRLVIEEQTETSVSSSTSPGSATSPADLMETSLEEKSATEPSEKDLLKQIQSSENAQASCNAEQTTKNAEPEGDEAEPSPSLPVSSACDNMCHSNCDIRDLAMPSTGCVAGAIKTCLEVPRVHKLKASESSSHPSPSRTMGNVECDWDRESYGSSDTSSYSSECHDDEEIALAIQAAELAARKEARSRFKNSADLIHRLFVCISGVADQLQTNYASDLRHILKCVFHCNASEPFVAMETTGDAGMEEPEQTSPEEETLAPEGSEDARSALSEGSAEWEGQGASPSEDAEEATENLRSLRTRSREEPPAWVPDEESPHCSSCKVLFNFVRRRHHCRNCGKVFCGRCSSNAVPLPHFGHTKPVRVCNHCFLFQVTPFTVDE